MVQNQGDAQGHLTRGKMNPKEKYRKGFVLVMTIVYGIGFIALISGFFNALLLAAVFSGIVYPLHLWFRKVFGGRNTLASLATLSVSLLSIVIPMILLLGLVAEQALEMADTVQPWIEQRLDGPNMAEQELPSWVPFRERLEPYRENISAKLAEVAGNVGVFLAASLAKLSEGAVLFFLNLFVMLYAMFFFLMSGPSLVEKILSYAPLSPKDKDKMIMVGLSVSRATVKGTLIIGMIQGALGGIGFAVAGIGSAVFWGAVMAVLSVLPGIGATLVWAPAVVYLLISGKMVAALGLLAWSAGVVGSVDNFLRPILVGRDSQMPDLLILLSTLGGLALFGASGLVLGPVLAALFLTVLAIYSDVFAEWLNPDQNPGNTAPDALSD